MGSRLSMVRATDGAEKAVVTNEDLQNRPAQQRVDHVREYVSQPLRANWPEFSVGFRLFVLFMLV